MQDYEYMYEVCLCSVLEDRSHKETLFTGFKLTGGRGGSVCRVWRGLMYDLTGALLKDKPGITENKITHFRIGWQT